MPDAPAPLPWYRGLTPYMWWVLLAAALGWLFDVMDQRIFNLSRVRALDELLSVEIDAATFERLAAGSVTAAQAAQLLGVEAGSEPGAVVRILPRAAAGTREAIALPPVTAGKTERKYSFVRPGGAGGPARVFPDSERNTFYGRIATAIFLAGWATGGIIFGVLGDKLGRAMTMMVTIVVYSLFTGLSAFSVSWLDYSLYRFLTGMGVGGEFAAAVALVAEVIPARSRPYALGMLQALSAVGNILGSLIAMWILPPADPGTQFEDWRALYLVGILPALLVLFVRGRVKEPDQWHAARESAGALVGKQLGAFGDLFRGRWKRSTVCGMLLGVAGVVGLWGIGFWTPELIKSSMATDPTVSANATALQDVGAFLGLLGVPLLTQGAHGRRKRNIVLGCLAAIVASLVFAWLGGGAPGRPLQTAAFGVSLCAVGYFLLALTGAITGGLGRRLAFTMAFILAWALVVIVFLGMTRLEQIYWMTPLLGFATLLPFGMYAIYFPELYPTRLRSTGTAFCYNVARYLAAAGLFGMGYLASDDFRVSMVWFSSIFVVGIVAAIFAPETKDKPLAEE